MARIPTSQKYLDLDIYRMKTSPEQLQEIRRTLAKRANQRLVRLERASSKITGESFASYGAADRAYFYLQNQTGKTDKRAGLRFKESKKAITDTMELKREISVLQGFLGSESSTVQGQRRIESSRIKAFESGEWGSRWKYAGKKNRTIKFASNKEFYDFLNSDTYKNLLAKGFTSEQIIDIYAQRREHYEGEDEKVVEEFEAALKEFREKNNATLKDLLRITGAKKLL